MRISPFRLALVLLFAVGPSCADPERPGETGALRFRFGVTSCGSTPIAKTPLARGGRSKLIVLDNQRRELNLSVASSDPAVLPVVDSVLLRKGCNELDCDVSVGTLWLVAAAAGRARVSFTDAADGKLVDAIVFTVAEPDRMELREYKKAFTSPLHVRQTASVTVQAVLLDAKGQELFAYQTYSFSADGGVQLARAANAEPDATMPVAATPTAQVGDTGVVSARFGSVSAELPVVLDPPPPPSN